jgi:hypothetical protein
MKTQERNFLIFNQNKQSLQWERKLLCVWHWLLSSLQGLVCRVQIRWRSLKQTAALQTCQVIRIASTTLNETLSNPRFLCGVGIFLVAPWAYWCYRFFDIDARDYDWYYRNYAIYFNTIRAELAGIFIFLGAFIAMPQKWAIRWWAIPIVIFCVTNIYVISKITHWTEFYNTMPSWQVWAVVLTCVPAVFFTANYFLYRKYHLKDGNLARVNGIIKAPGIPAELKIKLLEDLIHERESYNARV